MDSHSKPIAAPSSETENVVLGVLLRERDAIFAVMNTLKEEDLTSRARRRIYRAILDLTLKDTVPNVHTVATLVPEIPLEKIQELADRYTRKYAEELLYLVDSIKQQANLRRLNEVAGVIQEECQGACTDFPGMVYHGINMLSGLLDEQTEQDCSAEALNTSYDGYLEQLESENIKHYSTGFPWFDRKTNGYRPANMWLITARYKGRKSTLLRNLLLHPLREGASVDFFSLENTALDAQFSIWAMMIAEKLFANGDYDHTYITDAMLANNGLDDVQRKVLVDVREEYRKWNLRIYDSSQGVLSMDALALRVKRDKIVHGMELFALDYLQKMRGSDEYFQRIESATHKLQDLISTEQITGIVLAQLKEAELYGKRDAENQSMGVKGGGDPAAAADYGFRLEYDNDHADVLNVHLKVSRRSQTGQVAYRIHAATGLIQEEILGTGK